MKNCCADHVNDANAFNGCVYCDRLRQIDYSANLQKFVSCLIDDREPPQEVLDACPFHAEKYAKRKATAKSPFAPLCHEAVRRYREDKASKSEKEFSSELARELSRQGCLAAAHAELTQTIIEKWQNYRLDRPNVWLGCSVSDQETADRAIPELIKCRDLAPMLFLSCEPLLGPIEFSNVSGRSDGVSQLGKQALAGIDWVIVGGESGPDARPCMLEWCDDIRGQCQAAGVAFWMKQWGSNPVIGNVNFYDWDQEPEYIDCDPKFGSCSAGVNLLDSKGADPSEWPESLRVQQLPFFPRN